MALPEIADTAADGWRAATPVARSAFARFTSHQWYCHQARQSVYFSAFFTTVPDRDGLVDLAMDVASHIPELGALHEALTGNPLDRAVLAGVVSIEETDELSAYPDAWDVSGAEIFDRHDLPMIRVRAAIRRDGPDADGRRAALLVVSTHSLFEGADSALMSRSLPTGHTALNAPVVRHSLLRRLGFKLTAAVLGPAQLLLALAIAPRRTDKLAKSLVFERDQIRRVAARLGLRQRALMFALACFALNRGGKGYSRRRLSAIYANMDTAGRAGGEGAYFRHWMTEARFPVSADFMTFARGVEAEIDRLDRIDRRETQGLLHAVFGAHRLMRRWLPFIYSDRIFRFAGFYHLNLSVTPPHRLSGPLARNLVEPVHAGSYHPGLDMCVFVPGRKTVTFNCAVSARLAGSIDDIPALLDALDAEAAN